jgi:hypothetical protein
LQAAKNRRYLVRGGIKNGRLGRATAGCDARGGTTNNGTAGVKESR